LPFCGGSFEGLFLENGIYYLYAGENPLHPGINPFSDRKGQRMKTIKLLSLCACGFGLVLYSCGKDKGTTPDIGGQPTLYEADTLAAKAILDANQITGISPTNAICFPKEVRPAGTGSYRIVTIRLTHKNITVIPPEIGQLTGLENIWLDTNGISALPAEIGNCRALQFVDLSNNSLTTLPTEMGNMTALITLDLSNNSITALPAGFWSMTALKTIDLSHNALGSIDPLISNLVRLERLDVSYNQVTTLPSSLATMSSLQSIVVDNNKLCNQPQDVSNLISRIYQDTTWKGSQTCQ
jgi:hypothetical protein